MMRRRVVIAIVVAGVLGGAAGIAVVFDPARDHRVGPVGAPATRPITDQAPATSPFVSRSEGPPGVFALAGTVSTIVDGDTVDVDDDKGERLRVRIIGIDAPETADPTTPVQCWGPEASALAEHTLLRRHVSLYTDPSQAVRDRYGRLLAYVVLAAEGTNYSVLAAEAGAARSYVYGGKPVTAYQVIVAAEQHARSAHLGLWGPPCNGSTEKSNAVPDTSPSSQEPSSGASVYYPSCKAARAAGQAPLYRGEPGYRSGLDGDGDGVACE